MTIEKEYLPVSREDMIKRGIDEFDFIIISGDAYVDHPSFGTTLIGRLLEDEGFNVGIIPQPEWNDLESYKILGKPKYAFLVSSGNIDSMVNKYTVFKKKRKEDIYSPNGDREKRPDRAVTVYCNKLREAYKNVPIIIGGIEASLRRFAHYDYWSNSVKRSVLFDSKADLLVYGMAERSIIEVSNLLKYGMNIKDIKSVRGTCFIESESEIKNVEDYVEIPSYEDVVESKISYSNAYRLSSREQDGINGKTLIQKHGNRYLVQLPPPIPLKENEMDRVYDLPFVRECHPMYKKIGGIKALNEVKFSITSHRGCFGSCSFCALTFHQGRAIQKRSEESILNEVKILTKLNGFKGYINDIGGPTANFREKSCKSQEKNGLCKDKQCMFPSPCKNLNVNHSEYLSILQKARKVEGIKKVFIRSGIRYDYLMLDKNKEFFNELVKHHISGQLKVAPEHVVPKVLNKMGKPKKEVFDKFVEEYYKINKKHNKDQYLVPYLMSSHPGCNLNDALELALYIDKMGHTPEQVQDFYPTPGSLSTTMYYTGLDPITGEKVYIPKDIKEKNMQRALMQFKLKGNKKIVEEVLYKLKRTDLKKILLK